MMHTRAKLRLRTLAAAAALIAISATGALASCTVTTDLPEPCPESCESKPGARATCADGQCEIVCDEGRGDCDADPANGCEVDLTSDSAHCGSCERECGAATCDSSLCIPTVLFPEQVTPSRIVVDDEHVYWVNRGLGIDQDNQFPYGSVHRANRNHDGVFETIATDQNFAFDLAVDETHLYWTAANEHLVRRWPIDGSSAPEVFIDGRQFPTGIDVDATHVYLTEPGISRIVRAEKETASLQSLAEQTFALFVAVRNDFVYWAVNDGESVHRVATGGGAQQVLARGLSAPLEVAVTDHYAFVTNTPIGRGLPGPLVRIALDGGELVNVTSGSTIVGSVAVIGDWVYYGEGTPLFSLKRRPVDLSQEAETLIGGLDPIVDIAGDENGIYFLSLDSVYFFPP